MKKTKNIIILVLALVPLIVSLLPILIKYRSAEVPTLTFTPITYLRANEDTVLLTDHNVQTVQNGSIESIMLSAFLKPSSDGTLNIKKETSPIKYAIAKTTTYFVDNTATTDMFPYLYSMFYLYYIAILYFIDIFISLITYVPRKIMEMIDK